MNKQRNSSIVNNVKGAVRKVKRLHTCTVSEINFKNLYISGFYLWPEN